MRYLSIDIETTGLNAQRHNVLEFAAVLDDLRVQERLDALPRYHAYVLPPENGDDYVGDPFALALNAGILKKIAERDKLMDGCGWAMGRNVGLQKFVWPTRLLEDFELWCQANQLIDPKDEAGKRVKFVAAGKNVAGFDLPFLRAQCGFDRLRIHHRVLDPAMLYFDPAVDDVPPDLAECLRRAGLHDLVAHTAEEDALQVIQLIRHAFPLVNGKPVSRQIAFEHA